MKTQRHIYSHHKYHPYLLLGQARKEKKVVYKNVTLIHTWNLFVTKKKRKGNTFCRKNDRHSLTNTHTHTHTHTQRIINILLNSTSQDVLISTEFHLGYINFDLIILKTYTRATSIMVGL